MTSLLRFVSLCLLVTLSSATAAEPGPPAAALRTKVFHIRRRFFFPSQAVDLVPKAEQNLQKGVRLLTYGDEASYDEQRYDVREFLAERGIVLPVGGEAVYFDRSGVVMVRGTKENLKAVDDLLPAEDRPGSPLNLQLNFSLVEFAVKSEASDELGSLLVSELRKLAGDSWRELETLTVLGKSGRRFQAGTLRHEGAEPLAKPAAEDSGAAFFKPGEYGLRAEAEAVLGPDGATFDINVACNWRLRPGEPDARLQTNVTIADGHAILLQEASVPAAADSPPGMVRRRALILKPRVFSFTGWKLNEPQ